MKNLIIITIVFLFMSCSSTELVDSWRNSDVTEISVNKILIVGMTADTEARVKFEKRLKKEFNDRGIEAVMSIDVFNASQTTDEKTETELKELEKKLIDDGFDTILFSKIIGVDDKMAYNSTYKDLDYTYKNFRDDYYSNQDIYYNPEYYIKYKVYHAETSLYCICPIKDRELVWKGYIDIVDPDTSKRSIDDYVNLVLYALEQEQLLHKKVSKKERAVVY